jgi:hypothetical protein
MCVDIAPIPAIGSLDDPPIAGTTVRPVAGDRGVAALTVVRAELLELGRLERLAARVAKFEALLDHLPAFRTVGHVLIFPQNPRLVE